MLVRTAWLVLVATSLLACKKTAAPPPAPTPPPAGVRFIVARPTVVAMPLPARFTAALPASTAELQAAAYPPPPFIRRAIAGDLHGMRKRLVDGLTRAGAGGPIPESLAGFYVDVIGFASGREVCKWLVEVATGAAVPPPAREVAWSATTRCDESFASSLAGDEVPDRVIVDWYFQQLDAAELPFSPRVARAAAKVARTIKDDFELRKLGFVFARMQGAESVAAVTRLQRELADPRRAALVGVGMLRSGSPAGRAIGERACEHPAMASDPMCRSDDGLSGAAGGAKQPGDLRARIEHGEEPKELLAAFPRADVHAALARCAEAGPGHARRRCFERLVRLDRAAALVLAEQLATSGEAATARTARSLLRYPDVASAEHALRELGFHLDGEAAGDREHAPLSVEDVLVARGRSDSFDAETGMFPNEHDALLAQLAALARPTLDAVVFEEVPPSEAEMERGAYTLHAYVDGKRYTLGAENHGDWYDVEAVIGLLNALLAAKTSDTRLAALPTGDQMVTVVAGPARGLEALAAARLLDLGDPRDAERVGREAEQRALEVIGAQGHQVIAPR